MKPNLANVKLVDHDELVKEQRLEKRRKIAAKNLREIKAMLARKHMKESGVICVDFNKKRRV